MQNKETKYEDDKKKISEYVKYFTEGHRYRKSRQYKSALDNYHKSLNIIISSNLLEKQCESHFFIGQCNLKLNNIKESHEHLSKCDGMITRVQNGYFPFNKARGKVSADLIILKYVIDNYLIALNYARCTVNMLENSYDLDDKMIIFYHFIKELITFIYPFKKAIPFINEYLSVKNEVVFNNEKTICLSLKTSFYNLMNNTTKQTLFDRSYIMFYKYKYNLEEKNPLISFFEKNSEYMKDPNSQKAKTMLDGFIKNNKIMLINSSYELLLERKNRIETFNEFFELLANSFSTIFKNYFDKTNTTNIATNCNSNNIMQEKVFTPISRVKTQRK